MLVLLDDCGAAQWRKRWASLLRAWLRLPCCNAPAECGGGALASKRPTIAAAFEAANAKAGEAALSEIVGALGRRIQVEEQQIVQNLGRRLVVTVATVLQAEDALQGSAAACIESA